MYCSDDIATNLVTGNIEMNQIPLKNLSDDHLKYHCSLNTQLEINIKTFLIKYQETYLKQLDDLYQHHKKSISEFSDINTTVTKLNLTIGTETFLIYPIYFNHLIDDKGILCDSELLKSVIDIPTLIVPQECYYDTHIDRNIIKLFFDLLYSCNSPNLNELVKINLEQLKLLTILSNYL